MKKSTYLISGLIVISILATGCSALKEFSGIQEILKGEAMKRETIAIEMESRKDSFEVCSAEEKLELELTEPNNKSSFINYTIKNARLYQSLEETGIEKGEFIKTEYYENEIPIRVEPEEIIHKAFHNLFY